MFVGGIESALARFACAHAGSNRSVRMPKGRVATQSPALRICDPANSETTP